MRPGIRGVQHVRLCSTGRWGCGCLPSCPCSSACPAPSCSSPGSPGSSAEPVQEGQLQPTGRAEASWDTARATCVRHQAGPAGPPSYPGTALPLCLGGGLRKGGWYVALLGVTPSCGSAVCFGTRVTSSAVLSGAGLGQGGGGQGRASLALLIPSAGIKRAGWLLRGRSLCSADVDLFLCGPVPGGPMSSGNYGRWRGEEPGVHWELALRPSAGAPGGRAQTAGPGRQGRPGDSLGPRTGCGGWASAAQNATRTVARAAGAS